jgi:acyl carrier protein
MDNLGKYNQAFIKSFSITEEQLNSELTYQSISIWDSVGHMELIATLEDDFDIMLETNDIVDFSSYDHGKEILGKYGITF